MDRAAYLAALAAGLDALAAWEARWPAVAPDPTTIVPPERVATVLGELTTRLRDNYPFFHPCYAAQMMNPPHPVAQLAYALAMRINPNNHALDGGPATAALERETVAALAGMIGYPRHLGHLTSSGTIANLEALWVAREERPGCAIAYSAHAHYTHARACALLGVRGVPVACDAAGRLDLAALARHLAVDDVGTVVATVGTTGLGAVDPVHEIVPLAAAHGARVHADAAYGGFFALLAREEPSPVAAAPFRALAACDSVVVDPHKRGLQPFGCGAVLFRDPAVGRVYQHDSPYTYFTSAELHLGEISLECSRAGAAAAAFWATLQCLPLAPDAGLGPILARTRAAALAWAARLKASRHLRLVVEPELDILAYFPAARPLTASAIAAASDALFAALMADPVEPVYLAKMTVEQGFLAARHPAIIWDQPTTTVLRSVLMKPEHLVAVDALHARVERAAAAIVG
ncbi:MAG TPA: aminotransferase class I/II-fold pyridoxal phosphate-dependent enzyme [Chloroflexota bacterium]|nr:aminotransferase class I/II-fold pyridoxal phosphate-dependent enzyme [Chloroflexota bacterium]